MPAASPNVAATSPIPAGAVMRGLVPAAGGSSTLPAKSGSVAAIPIVSARIDLVPMATILGRRAARPAGPNVLTGSLATALPRPPWVGGRCRRQGCLWLRDDERG